MNAQQLQAANTDYPDMVVNLAEVEVIIPQPNLPWLMFWEVCVIPITGE